MSATAETSLPRRWYHFLPATVTTTTRIFAWSTLATQIIIVGTGGAVRLTGSGLGCDTWPQCTEDSFVATPEMGIHGLIEFGNRTLTGLLLIVALITFLLVIRTRPTARGLIWPILAIGGGIAVQGVVGGITVWTGLNSYIVGLHFVISSALVALSALLVWRCYHHRSERLKVQPVWVTAVTYAAALFAAVTVVIGILTTGSGPHAGDADTPRNGLNPELLQHLHSYPAYILAALTVVLLVAAALRPSTLLLRWTIVLAVAELAQIVIGLVQARMGLPPLLVGIHMVLACVLVSAMMAVVLALRQPAHARF